MEWVGHGERSSLIIDLKQGSASVEVKPQTNSHRNPKEIGLEDDIETGSDRGNFGFTYDVHIYIYTHYTITRL